MLFLDDCTVNEATLENDISKIIIIGILNNCQCDEKKKLIIEQPDGGYANKNVIVHPVNEPDNSLFVRLFNPKLQYYLRHNKRHYKFYNDQGLSIRIHCLFGNGCIMDVVKGTPITLATTSRLYESDIQRAIAEEVARYHRDGVLEAAKLAGFETGIGWHEPQWFQRLFKGLERFSNKEGKQMSLPTAEDTMRELDMLTRRLDERNSPLAFCHGDLNPSNIIYNEDTKRATFVDYDSPCVTHAVFDIAVHFMVFHDTFNARRPPPSVEYRRKWLFRYLTKKNELNGIHTFAPVSDGEIDRYMDDLKIAHLKASLHFMSCFSALLTEMADPDKPMDPVWLVGIVSEHWTTYLEEKNILDEL